MITEVAFLTTGIAVGVLAEHIINNVRVEQAYDKGVEDGFNRHKAMVKAERKETINSDALDDLVEAYSYAQACNECPFKGKCRFDGEYDLINICQQAVYRALNIEV